MEMVLPTILGLNVAMSTLDGPIRHLNRVSVGIASKGYNTQLHNIMTR